MKNLESQTVWVDNDLGEVCNTVIKNLTGITSFTQNAINFLKTFLKIFGKNFKFHFDRMDNQT